MAKQNEAQKRLEELQAARNGRLEEIAGIREQIAQLEAKQQALEEQAAVPGEHVDTPALMEVLSTISSLRRVLKSLSLGKQAIDSQVEAAMADVNRIEIGKLHRQEKQVWDRVVSAAFDLKAQIDDLDVVRRDLQNLRGTPWCTVPKGLRMDLNEQYMKNWTPGTFASYNIEAYDEAS
jgi:uncharacterized phage infection (PIP) family protein YhgE